MSKTHWIGTRLEEAAHERLVNLATKRGVHPSKLIAQFVEDGLTTEGLKPGASYDLRLYATAQQANRVRVRRQQLESIAWEVAQTDDTETFDKLERLCEEAGFPVNEIIKTAKTYDSPPILVSQNGTGIDAAMRWLQDRFKDRSTWPASEITDLGQQRGFSKSTLGSAKRQLGYASIRESEGWVWKKIEEEHEEEGTLI